MDALECVVNLFDKGRPTTAVDWERVHVPATFQFTHQADVSLPHNEAHKLLHKRGDKPYYCTPYRSPKAEPDRRHGSVYLSSGLMERLRRVRVVTAAMESSEQSRVVLRIMQL